MNKNAIKKFAIEARQKLIRSVIDKAGMVGITEKSCSEPITKGVDFEVYLSTSGREVTLIREQCNQRKQLELQIKSRGFEAVVEEVAYTWFNRICAIRFMEVNDYLPNRVRVLSSEKEGKMEPDLVTQAPDVDLELTAQEKEEIINWKMSGTSEDTDKLYCKLFLKQCHQLHDILPGLFEADSDYMELLFGISYTNKDDVIYMLVNPETGIPEADFNVSTLDAEGNPTGQVEIIGWLYQYYNTELKDDTFAKLKKNVKITKERIPAATQLFTPDWIVRYMVENSVGRIWIEHLRAVNPGIDEKATAERFGWKYYLPEAEQEESVDVKLAEIRTTYKELKPTDITCIDPCMGSGHILIAMFDVLMDIYESAGYDKREAAFEIVEHNIHGLDIDQRAYQLAYFAVMMKGRTYNRRFLYGKKVVPHVYQIKESGYTDKNGEGKYSFDQATLDYFIGKNVKLKESMENLIYQMFDALEYGSIIKIENVDFKLIFDRLNEVKEEISLYKNSVLEGLYPFISVGHMLATPYDAVVTNPPYMGASGMGAKLSKYVKDNYQDSKSDLFAVFIEKCSQMVKKDAYQAMITQHAWMFLSSFEKLRNKIQMSDIVNMAHLGPRAFEEIGGEVVQTTSFIFRKSHIKRLKGTYCRLIDSTTQQGKEKMFLNAENRYFGEQDKFSKIPGSPVAYWVSEQIIEDFEKGKRLGNISKPRQGMATTNNNRFLRLWYEVEINNIGFNLTSIEETVRDEKWYPYNKGGEFRKWYGNNDYVVNFKNKGQEVCDYIDKTSAVNSKGRVINREHYFHECISWSLVSSGNIAFRYKPQGFIFDVAGMSCFAEHDLLLYLLGLNNTKVVKSLMGTLAPTINFQAGDIANIPVIFDANKKNAINEIVAENIEIERDDWDSFEISWDFKTHPLMKNRIDTRNRFLKNNFECWQEICNDRFTTVKRNEEILNEYFIGIYKLQNELSPGVDNNDITVRKSDLSRDIRSYISYAVGCMFGRYSLDKEGLIYAGGEWDNSRYKSFLPDDDNCIPITDEEYFSDDIVARFVEFVKIVYGADTLEENLDFIANALGNKGDTSREVIRNYFLKDFYADHLKVYQKRPIYWLFDSGKQNGFKALIYIHRYDADTVGRVRTDYLHRAQKYVETAMQSAQYIINNASSASEKSKATKAVTKYTKQLAEMKIYDEAIAHIANKRLEIDLDDGVKVNYAKFQGVEVAQEGKKTLKVDLLAKMK
ncbi:BREX-1 system adenine-specific DNA-methyltransferase PglX [Dorea sp. OM02-2LB]|nr:BREX-1 system adenine-specific DNA-methyltransferase PglX [Dorea sp. OM02-2LB]